MTGNHVGGVLNRWEFYLSGDANRQMSFAEENAKKGQLALSPEAYDALETRFGTLVELDVVCHASGNYLILETPGESPVSGLALTPCRLNVTVAFVKLEGVIEIKDAQTQLQTIHQNLCTIQECAYKAQGMLRQFLIDDKGAVAIVGIGLPPFFHENNELQQARYIAALLEAVLVQSLQ
ncbi:hypothetical protein PInf_024244 [Phytophthora infestans]|nr:hypothetical protein PInf_024244 [Phytophthora infestans]